MKRWAIALLGLAVLLPAPAARAADDEEPTLDFFYPIIARRPVIEREVELSVDHEKGAGGRETAVRGALELPVLPRWQIELEVPLVFRDPREGAATGGVGDVTVENKVVLFKSLQHRILVAGGLEATLPTGSERRGLGGEAAIEPFVTGAIAAGPLDVIADAAYEMNLNSHVKGEQQQELSTGVATAWRLSRWFDPLVELTAVQQTRGEDPDLRHRTQVYVTPGFNTHPLPETTFRIGIELPVTRAREFDYAIRAGFVKEF